MSKSMNTRLLGVWGIVKLRLIPFRFYSKLDHGWWDEFYKMSNLSKMCVNFRACRFEFEVISVFCVSDYDVDLTMFWQFIFVIEVKDISSWKPFVNNRWHDFRRNIYRNFGCININVSQNDCRRNFSTWKSVINPVR